MPDVSGCFQLVSTLGSTGGRDVADLDARQGSLGSEETQREDALIESAMPETGSETEIRERRVQWRTLLRAHYAMVLAAVLLATFGVLTFLALGLEPLAFDVPVTLGLQRMQWGWFEGLMVAVSVFGFWPWMIVVPIAAMAILVALRVPKEAVWLGVAAISAVASEAVKVVVQRPRPTSDLVSVAAELHTYSFPSGHVTSYVTFYGFIFYLAYTGLRRGWARTVILVLSGMMVLLVGPSRVWLGQHWASDALGGYALGFFMLLVLIQLHRAWATRAVRAEQAQAAEAG
ncbi:MAG TPA: phosphatase PAP2 family protein [Chloroflexia bacterium]|nr:phosphatase PAP2 family protein [Chloroflexia bacterium]